MRVPTIVAVCGAALLTLTLTACTYSGMGVGNARTISAKQALANAREDYGDVPTPIEEHAGTGAAVQQDRMVTVDLNFSDADNNPVSSSQIRFVHSSIDKSLDRDFYTFGYASPALLAAMAGMRQGGTRRVQPGVGKHRVSAGNALGAEHLGCEGVPPLDPAREFPRHHGWWAAHKAD